MLSHVSRLISEIHRNVSVRAYRPCSIPTHVLEGGEVRWQIEGQDVYLTSLNKVAASSRGAGRTQAAGGRSGVMLARNANSK